MATSFKHAKAKIRTKRQWLFLSLFYDKVRFTVIEVYLNSPILQVKYLKCQSENKICKTLIRKRLH